MSKNGTYYAGRVHKLGRLDESKLLDALRNPVSVKYRGNAWTFVDIEEYNQSSHHYIYGQLSKYSPEGEVRVIDEPSRSEIKQDEPNLLVASSPFVYIPAHSGIAFLNVSNQIELRTFIRRFVEIVEATHDYFFVECDIELISDLKSFAVKLASLDNIYKIEARISPPNPLFGPLWKDLEEYLQKRKTGKMTVVEDAQPSEGLATSLPNLVAEAALQTEEKPFKPEFAVPLGDAAILMAADGYGLGKVRGGRGEEIIVIKTSETAINFTFDKTPEPHQLYEKALKIFEHIERQRHMEHGEWAR